MENKMSYWLLIKPFLKYIIPLLIGLLIGGYTVNKINGITINKLKKENAIYDTVNQTNQQTILDLQSTIKKDQDMCNDRLKNKDKIINKLKKVDNLKPGDANEKDPNDPDSILGTLNSLWPKDNK
jgi:mannitol-specific phosphotransferase system IIBC component